MSNLLLLPESDRVAKLTHGFFDDFNYAVAAPPTSSYTVVTAVDGTVLGIDGAGGQVEIINAVATIGDNEDTYMVREPESFLLAAGKPLRYVSSTKFTQVGTNATAIFSGLTDGAAANLLVTDGTVKASGETICFYTKNGSLSLFVYAYNTTAVLDVELTAANSLDNVAHLGASTAFRELAFEFLPKSSTQADLVFYDAGVPCYKMTDFLFTATTPTELQAVIGVKGGTAAAHTITADYLGCRQYR